MSRATGTYMQQYFDYMPGLAELVTSPSRYREDIVIEFYDSPWVARDRSEIWFIFRG